jgi:hypothetical protein
MRLDWTCRTALCALLGIVPAFAQPYALAALTAQYIGNTQLYTTPAPGSVSQITAGAATISFSTALSQAQVPGSWAVWGSPPNTETATPAVLRTPAGQTSLTVTLSPGVTTFGFEIEPARICAPFPGCATIPPTATPFTISATFYNGAAVLATVSQAIAYDAARLFALSSVIPITSVQISSPADANGFAMAQFRVGSALLGAPGIPAAGAPAFGALALLLAAAGALLARRQNAAA